MDGRGKARRHREELTHGNLELRFAGWRTDDTRESPALLERFGARRVTRVLRISCTRGTAERNNRRPTAWLEHAKCGRRGGREVWRNHRLTRRARRSLAETIRPADLLAGRSTGRRCQRGSDCRRYARRLASISRIALFGGLYQSGRHAANELGQRVAMHSSAKALKQTSRDELDSAVCKRPSQERFARS
jgi:hypothetical protein